MFTGKNNLVTVFALDARKTAIFFVEGHKDGSILKVWESAADYYPTMKPLFSTTDSYFARVYPGMYIYHFIIIIICNIIKHKIIF